MTAHVDIISLFKKEVWMGVGESRWKRFMLRRKVSLEIET